MSQVSSIPPTRPISHTSRVEGVLPDTFSQKVGDWAFKGSQPSIHNVQIDVPSAFSVKPVDAVIIDYLEEALATSQSLPVAHLYDGALERLIGLMDDPVVLGILQADLELRNYLKMKRIGEVYE